MGSRKYLLASLDQSLKRLGLDYVDIFYHHHFDPTTPMEESLGALDSAVRQARRSTSASSSYSDERTLQRSGSCAISVRRSSFTSRRIRC